MELIRPGTHYDFIGKRKYTLLISTVTILVTFGSILYHGGLRNGVDFAGGLAASDQILEARRIFRRSGMPWKPGVEGGGGSKLRRRK